MKENIDIDIEIIKSIDCLDDIELERAIKVVINELERLQKENEELKEYKRISELTKISCCTAQNCEALSNAIRDSLENEKLKKENEELKSKLKATAMVFRDKTIQTYRDNEIELTSRITDLQKENEELKMLMAHKNGYTKQLEQDLYENASNYVIPKQKIKDKIEEVKNEEDLYARGNIIAILLELLEEEE